MSSDTIGLLAASVFLLIAVVGGGFTVKELSVPTVPTWARVVAGVLGVLFAVPFALNLVDSDDAGVLAAGTAGGSDEVIAPSVGGTVQIHQDSQPDTSPESISLVEVVATAPSGEPTVMDRVTVTFTFENAGDVPVTLDNTFVGARGPGDEWADFGEGHYGAVLQPGEQLTVTSGKIVDGPGIWTFWPCYQVGDGLCPDEWRAFEVAVAQ